MNRRTFLCTARSQRDSGDKKGGGTMSSPQMIDWELTWPQNHCGIPMDEWHNVAKWAFGEGYQFTVIGSWPSCWRVLHPDLFTIKTTDDLYETTKRVYQAYQEAGL